MTSGTRRIGDLRGKYPRSIRREVPGGDARTFVRTTIEEILKLQGKSDQRQRRVDLEDLLVETAAGVAEVTRALLEVAREGPPEVRRAALLMLGRYDDPAARSFLVHDGLGSSDATTRLASVLSLAQDSGWNVRVGKDRRENFTSDYDGAIGNPEVLGTLLQHLRIESDEGVLKALLTVLSNQLQNGEFADAEDIASHPDGMRYAAQTLDGFAWIIRNHPNTEIRALALSSIQQCDLPEVWAILGQAAKEAPTESERCSALLALESTKDPSNISVIVEAMSDPSSGIRNAAVQAATAAGRDERVLGLLLNLYRTDPDPTVRLLAYQSAVFNLTSNSPGSADFPRALQIMDDSLSASRYDTAYVTHSRDLLRRIEGAIRSGQYRPTPEEAERIRILRDAVKR